MRLYQPKGERETEPAALTKEWSVNKISRFQVRINGRCYTMFTGRISFPTAAGLATDCYKQPTSQSTNGAQPLADIRFY